MAIVSPAATITTARGDSWRSYRHDYANLVAIVSPAATITTARGDRIASYYHHYCSWRSYRQRSHRLNPLVAITSPAISSLSLCQHRCVPYRHNYALHDRYATYHIICYCYQLTAAIPSQPSVRCHRTDPPALPRAIASQTSLSRGDRIAMYHVYFMTINVSVAFCVSIERLHFVLCRDCSLCLQCRAMTRCWVAST